MFSARIKTLSRTLGNSPVGKIAQQRAVESLQNIAGLEIGGGMQISGDIGGEQITLSGQARVNPVPDADLDAIINLLKPEGSVAISAVAKKLGLDVDRAAEALMRGGQIGILHFKKEQDTTMVTLA